MSNIVVIDDIYDDVNQIREFALSQQFDELGNFPGARTSNFLTESIQQKIEYAIGETVVDWHPMQYSGCFQITNNQSNNSWVHHDASNNWAGVLYLTPNAPVSGGTGFFKSKIDGSLVSSGQNFPAEVLNDMSLWDKVSEVGNVYNRLVLFRSDQWHRSLDYFGDSLEDGRLTQVFFLNTTRSISNVKRNKKTIKELFPKGFYTIFDIPNFDELSEFCSKYTESDNNQFTWQDGCNVNTSYVSVGDSVNLLRPTLNEFSKQLKYNFDCTCHDPWLNYYNRDSFQEVHNHADHDFSAVFFMNEGEDFSKFYFYESKGMGHARWVDILPEVADTNNYFSTQKGKVIIFPGWMNHGVTRHKSDTTRVTMACNFNFQ